MDDWWHTTLAYLGPFFAAEGDMLGAPALRIVEHNPVLLGHVSESGTWLSHTSRTFMLYEPLKPAAEKCVNAPRPRAPAMFTSIAYSTKPATAVTKNVSTESSESITVSEWSLMAWDE
ncbi:hypothetical protein LTR22_026881, partial [Elasticomyces elasticus]